MEWLGTDNRRLPCHVRTSLAMIGDTKAQVQKIMQQHGLCYNRVVFTGEGGVLRFSDVFANEEYMIQAPVTISSSIRLFSNTKNSFGSLKLCKRGCYYTVAVLSNKCVDTSLYIFAGGSKDPDPVADRIDKTVEGLVERIKREVSRVLPRIDAGRIKMMAPDLSEQEFDALVSAVKGHGIEVTGRKDKLSRTKATLGRRGRSTTRGNARVQPRTSGRPRRPGAPSAAGTPVCRSPEETDATLRASGSCVVELENAVLLQVLHVNTVGNQKFSATVFSERLRRYARIQSNTTKTVMLSRLRFVSDKKRLSSHHGYRNTRIEFSSNPSRSANYTSNAKHPLQSYFRGLFDTVSLAQGTCVVSTKPFAVSNENLTCYVYGVANPLTVVIRMKKTERHFHTPFFFSSVNVAGEENRHQLFSSMSINSQRVRSAAEELPTALSTMASMLEIHVHLNRLCCELAQKRRGMLTSREKLCLVYLTETYFLRVRDRSRPEHWRGYREAVRGAFVERYRSRLSSFQDKALSNYHAKNPEFIHLVPWLVDNPTALHAEMLLGHEAYLREEGKWNARAELIAAVTCHVESDPTRCPPDGFPCLRAVDFSRLGYSERTLRLALDKSSILRIWDITNGHYETTLRLAGREDTRSRAESLVRSHVRGLQELRESCVARLKKVEAYVEELRVRELGTGGAGGREGARSCEALAGEWHFLHMPRGDVFGYMKLVPETLSVVEESDGLCCRRAEFTLPPEVMIEARRTLFGEDRSDGIKETASYPCCGEWFGVAEFWRHALFEIAERGNRVPARRPAARPGEPSPSSPSPVWTVEERAGWPAPIYRPRRLRRTCEIGGSLLELNLNHFVSDSDFSRALDRAFNLLALTLRP
ncbi:hypothetical protein Q5P01_021958 [Channa striata]|uniref:Uncharacterized protein n=1 Tax=Channa striata TaxID=64152 RepID=A0AA88LLF6_CHASR|nr:hypothetical protein Q5P01_021958 [Channa striata]